MNSADEKKKKKYTTEEHIRVREDVVPITACRQCLPPTTRRNILFTCSLVQFTKTRWMPRSLGELLDPADLIRIAHVGSCHLYPADVLSVTNFQKRPATRVFFFSYWRIVPVCWPWPSSWKGILTTHQSKGQQLCPKKLVLPPIGSEESWRKFPALKKSACNDQISLVHLCKPDLTWILPHVNLNVLVTPACYYFWNCSLTKFHLYNNVRVLNAITCHPKKGCVVLTSVFCFQKWIYSGLKFFISQNDLLSWFSLCHKWIYAS